MSREPNDIPEDLAPVAERLDRLAERERARPDDGFNARIAGDAARASTPVDPVVGRVGFWRAARLAAAVAIVAAVGVGGALLVRQPVAAPVAGSGAPADPDLGALLEAGDAWDDPIDDRLRELDAELDRLAADFDGFWGDDAADPLIEPTTTERTNGASL